MGATEILVSGGVAAVLASLVGGGLKAFGIELPILASVRRQILLAVAGLGLLASGLLVDHRTSQTPPTGGLAQAGGGTDDRAATATGSPRQETPSASPAAVAAAQPEVPNIVGLPFPAARQFLLQNSWSPINSASGPRASSDRLGLRGQELWNAGYREVVSCSDSGLAPCMFRYRDRRGHILEVIAVGEGTPAVNDVILVDCNRRSDQAAC